jgi:hypothetical protein
MTATKDRDTMAANTATDRRRGRPRWAFWLVAATASVTLGACAASSPTIAPSASAAPTTAPSSLAPPANGTSPLPPPTDPSLVPGAPAPHLAVELSVGTPYTYWGPSGDGMQVTVLALIDPAQGTSGAHPADGYRFVAAKLQINGWASSILVDPNRDAALILGDNTAASALVNDVVKGCTNFHRGSYAIDAGDVIDGCLVFQVFNDDRLHGMEWGVA